MTRITRDLATLLDAHQSALAERILACSAGLCLIHALPGAGKSSLLHRIAAITGATVHRTAPDDLPAGRGPVIVDLRSDAEISLPEAPDRLWIVAAHPDQVHDHARLLLYGKVRHLGNADLFLANGSGLRSGWPAIALHLARAPDDRNTIRAFLSDVVLKRLPADLIALVQALALSRNGLSEDQLDDGQRAALHWLSPLLTGGPARAWRFGKPDARRQTKDRRPRARVAI